MNLQIANSAKEQSLAASNINDNVASVSVMIESATDSTKEVSQASNELAKQAAQLQALMDKLQL